MNLVFKSLMVAGALVVAGCASAPDPRPRATAAAETVRVSMDVSAIDNGLTWNQIDVIEAVAAEYKARGHGPLVISYPQNAGNADAAIGAIAEARTRLYAAGLDWRQIQAAPTRRAPGQRAGDLLLHPIRSDCAGVLDHLDRHGARASQ